MTHERIITTYDFDELDEKAKNFAINEQIEFIMETTEYEQGSDGFKKALEKADELKTPWFTGEYIWDYCREEVLEGLRQYEFFENGKVFGNKSFPLWK